jgi:carbamoyltransferase
MNNRPAAGGAELFHVQLLLRVDTARQRSAEVATLRARLAEANYSEEGLSTVLGQDPTMGLAFGQMAVLDRYLLRFDEPLHLAIRLLYLGLAVNASALLPLFDEDQCQLLVELGLVTMRSDGLIQPQATVYPIRGLFVCTDRAFATDQCLDERGDIVMSLGSDSYSMALLGQGSLGETVLDLCTGSGVAALVAGVQGRSVVGVDINPRAVAFARFNAAFNALEACSFCTGDLYSAVQNESFDLILANPPFVPTPALGGLLYRDGGPGGDQVLSRIVEGLSSHLREGGTCLITANQAEHEGIAYEDKIQGWLGAGGAGYQCLIVSAPALTPEAYAMGHHASLAHSDRALDEAHRWIRHYHAEGITSICAGHLLIHRTASADSSFRCVRLPISGDVNLHAHTEGLADQMLRRLRGLSADLSVNVSLTANLEPENTAVTLPSALYSELELAYPLVQALLADDEGPVTEERITERLAEQGYELGEEEIAEMRETIRQLYLLGFLNEG